MLPTAAGAPTLRADSILLATGLHPLWVESDAIRANELLVALNADYVASSTCWARLGGTLHEPGAHSRLNRALDTLTRIRDTPGFALALTPGPRRSPANWTAHLTGAHPAPLADTLAKAVDWRPDQLPVLRPGGAGQTVSVYTDGSTDEHRDHPSGCSAVFANRAGTVEAAYGFAISTRGNTYIAEAVAVL